MKVAAGRIKVTEDGKEMIFSDGVQACKAFEGSSFVKGVESADGLLSVSLEKNLAEDKADQKEWMRKYEEEYNEEVSFF